MTDVVPGALLLATPDLLDPNFSDTVVLMLDSDEDGAIGVVLNRPSQVLVDDIVAGWGEVCAEPEVLFQGGPVSTDGALALALLRDPDDEPVGFRPIVGRLGVIDLDAPLELVDGTLEGLRVFAGYAGWGADQLAREIEEGSWYVVPCEVEDAFRGDTQRLRGDVLRRQPGELAWHSTRPLDPEMN